MKTLLSAVAACVLLTGTAFAAEDAKKADAKPMATTTAPAKKAKAAQSELSKKCSAEADAKKLHGKERKAFRKACLKKPA